MNRGRIDLAVTLFLLAALPAAAATGVLAEALGTERSIFHRAFAYTLFALGCAHVLLKWRALLSRLRAAFIPGHRTETSVQQGAVGSARARVSLPSRRNLLVGAAAAGAGFALRPWLLPSSSIPARADGDLGELYHQWSKPSFSDVLTKPLSWGIRPPLYRDFPGSQRVPLPPASGRDGLTVEQAIQRRRSVRDYAAAPLRLDQLSALLYAASGTTEPRDKLRASPSAGAQYPLEVYVIAHDVSGLPPGIYHYEPREHALDVLRNGDFRLAALAASGGQDMAGSAAAVLVVSAVFQRTRWRYHDRAYRYVLLDAGHLGENVYLQATSLGLGVCGMGAFLDDEINSLVGADGKGEAAVYLLALGRL